MKPDAKDGEHAADEVFAAASATVAACENKFAATKIAAALERFRAAARVAACENEKAAVIIAAPGLEERKPRRHSGSA